MLIFIAIFTAVVLALALFVTGICINNYIVLAGRSVSCVPNKAMFSASVLWAVFYYLC